MAKKYNDGDMDDKPAKSGKGTKGKKPFPFPLSKKAGGAKLQAQALRDSMRGKKGGK